MGGYYFTLFLLGFLAFAYGDEDYNDFLNSNSDSEYGRELSFHQGPDEYLDDPEFGENYMASRTQNGVKTYLTPQIIFNNKGKYKFYQNLAKIMAVKLPPPQPTKYSSNKKKWCKMVKNNRGEDQKVCTGFITPGYRFGYIPPENPGSKAGGFIPKSRGRGFRPTGYILSGNSGPYKDDSSDHKYMSTG